MELYIILKDGKPYITNAHSKRYVKAYYDEKLAIKTAKGFCTTEASHEFAYGSKWYKEHEFLDHKERNELANELTKGLSARWFDERWEIKKVEL